MVKEDLGCCLLGHWGFPTVLLVTKKNKLFRGMLWRHFLDLMKNLLIQKRHL